MREFRTRRRGPGDLVTWAVVLGGGATATGWVILLNGLSFAAPIWMLRRGSIRPSSLGEQPPVTITARTASSSLARWKASTPTIPSRATT